MTSGRLEYGWATPVGGSGALPAAGAALITDHAGHILSPAAVTRIELRHGRAVAVDTTAGQRVGARVGARLTSPPSPP